jgi:hypothetical protein
MMGKVTVRKDRHDWIALCEHFVVYTDCWQSAYEAAVGHACMVHPRTVTRPRAYGPVTTIGAMDRMYL